MADHRLPGEFLYEGACFDSTNSSAKMLDLARSLTLTPQDVLLTAYPKSGTAWVKLIIELVLGEGQELGGRHQMSTFSRFPRLEHMQQGINEEDTLRFFQSCPSPRLFGTHLNSRLLEKQITEDQAKVIVAMRNPKDTLVSFYHFYRMASFLGSFSGSWDEFFEMFKRKRLLGGDIFEYNLGFWQMRERENVLVVFYEDLKKDCPETVRQVAKHLGKHLSNEVVEKIAQQTSFKQMKGNPKLLENSQVLNSYIDSTKGTYFRKGEVGDWKNHFTQQQSVYIDERSEELWQPVGLNFRYDA